MLVALFADEIRKWITSVFGVSSEIFVFIAIIVLLVFGIVTSIVIVMINRHHEHERSQEENITMSIPSQKRASWFSKLRRSPIKKEKRAEFWVAVTTMIIVGAVMITIALSFPSVPMSSEAPRISLIIRIAMISAGITMMSLFAWLTTNELYAMWESHKQLVTDHETAYLNLIKKFSRAFRAVQEASDPDVKAIMLGDFQDQLRDLCYNYEWNKVKGEIEKVLEYIIPEKLFNEPHAKKYIQFLAIIINRFGEHVISAVSKKWLREIDKFYDDPDYGTSSISNVLYILLQLRGYSKDYLTKLIDDATRRWSELKFHILVGDLGVAFDELKKRDESAHEEIISYLRRKMGDAKQDKEEGVYGRLNTLFKMANR